MIKSYSVKHRKRYNYYLQQARKVAEYAIKHKTKNPSTSAVKDINLPSAIKNQLMRKYGRGNAKSVKNISLVIPNMHTKYTMKNGGIKTYSSITYDKGHIHIKCLDITFRWNPGYSFEKINQIEINKYRYIITITVKDSNIIPQCTNYLGVDMNCGAGRHIANIADLKNKTVFNMGKRGPNIRKKYFKKRKIGEVKGEKESRIMKDIDHKISRKIVNYALEHKLQIVLEDLKGIRDKHKKGNDGQKNVNRFVNSWSFFRLQTYISYKAKERDIPVVFINPRYKA